MYDHQQLKQQQKTNTFSNEKKTSLNGFFMVGVAHKPTLKRVELVGMTKAHDSFKFFVICTIFTCIRSMLCESNTFINNILHYTCMLDKKLCSFAMQTIR